MLSKYTGHRPLSTRRTDGMTFILLNNYVGGGRWPKEATEKNPKIFSPLFDLPGGQIPFDLPGGQIDFDLPRGQVPFDLPRGQVSFDLPRGDKFLLICHDDALILLICQGGKSLMICHEGKFFSATSRF